MDLTWIWKAVVVVIGGTFLLRFAGRKSIAQMTLAQTVIMIAIGSLLIQPVAGDNIWRTLGAGAVLVLTLIFLEFVQVKGDPFEKLITGKSKVLIENGTINEKNLKKLRLTVDQLEMTLRQQNVQRIDDVKYATLEPNGQVGYILKEEAQTVTKKDLQLLRNDLQETINQLVNVQMSQNQPQQQQYSALNNQPVPTMNQDNMFKEVENNEHQQPPPERLQ
ncbi:DUF421 domain-containing protein [Oceanobacillus halotolerans]|uniref:DUF421 domain-containing protein n=1 Tax=Oceanobacillus halotolerans TaxID=2663380 RepID=UPI0013DCF6A8|nr:DUF421 domain-containing protein [Oceanobacillus halotolerans]